MSDMTPDGNQFADCPMVLDPQIEQYFHFALEEASAKVASATKAFDAGQYDRMSDALKDLHRLSTGAVESLPAAPERSWTERISHAAEDQRTP